MTAIIKGIADDLELLEMRGWTSENILDWLGELRVCFGEIQTLLNKNTISTYSIDYEVSDAIDEIAIFERRYGGPEEPYARREV
jgi:hypothetical protein